MEKSEYVWRKRWKLDTDGMGSWVHSCELIESILLKEVRVFGGKLCLEGGSGTGRVSLRLGHYGALPTLLDTSKEAIKFSKKLASEQQVDAHFVIGSIFNLPFQDSSLHLAWNEGVLEHFEFQKQQLAVSEFLRVLKSGEKAVIIVPSKKAWVYNLFRILSIKIRTWIFGYEKPFSKKDFEKFSPRPKLFHSCGLFWQFTRIYIPKPSLKKLNSDARSSVVGSEAQLDWHGQSILTSKFLRVLRFLHLLSYVVRIDKNYPGHFIAAIWVKDN